MRLTRISRLGISLLRSRVFESLPPIQNHDLSNLRNTDEMRELLQESYDRMKEVGIKYDPKSMKLEPRRMSESRCQFSIPLASDEAVRKRYISYSGAVRFGKLLEDLDYFAVWVSYMHNQGSEASFFKDPSLIKRTVVTACVHRIDLQRLILSSDKDLILDGFVSWAGKSSLETSLRILQEDTDGSLTNILKAKFVMVSRDPTDAKSVPVHPLSCQTPEEIAIFEDGEKAVEDRQNDNKISLFVQKPTLEEMDVLHKKFLLSVGEEDHNYERRPLREGESYGVKLQTVRICFPEHRNIYGKIFGGYVMREAFELAVAASKEFCKHPTEVCAVDDIVFRAAVNTGDMLKFNARVTYTKDCYIQVRVDVQVSKYDKSFTSNTMHFSFKTRDGSKVAKIIPKEYNDGWVLLNGRRHLLKSLASNHL